MQSRLVRRSGRAAVPCLVRVMVARSAATAVVSSRDVRRIVALLSPATADEINVIAADALRALTSGANVQNSECALRLHARVRRSSPR